MTPIAPVSAGAKAEPAAPSTPPTSVPPSILDQLLLPEGNRDMDCVERMNNLVKRTPDCRTQDIMDVFGGVMGYSRLPKLEWDDSFHAGGTGYIDGIKPSDLKYPVMQGVDWAKRPFIVLKTKTVEGTKQHDKFGDVEGATAIFQRYTNDPSLWVNGCHCGPGWCSSSMRDKHVATLKELVTTGRSTADYWRAFGLTFGFDCPVQLVM